MLFFQQINGSFVLFFFNISRSRSLSPFFLVELRRPAAYFLFFSVFLLLYIPNLWTWQLIYVSALQDAGGYVISRQNNLELHLGCHTCWLVILHWYARGSDGRSFVRAVGVRSRNYQIFCTDDTDCTCMMTHAFRSDFFAVPSFFKPPLTSDDNLNFSFSLNFDWIHLKLWRFRCHRVVTARHTFAQKQK